MLTFERRRSILKLIAEQPGLKVSQMATRLDVSEGTIRNDLDALAQEQKLQRVRGGAVLLSNGEPFASPIRPQSAAHQREAKQKIARWAAELVEDGDVILLDASTTAQQMIPFFQDRRNLTIVTNGLEVVAMLRRQSHQGFAHHTVILVGGLINDQTNATGGLIGEALLDRLHIQKAFVSAAGFTLESGLLERTVEQAQMKEKILRAAEETILLLTNDQEKLNLNIN